MPKISSISIAVIGTTIVSNCILKFEVTRHITDEFEHPYEHTVLLNYKEDSEKLHSIEIIDVQELIRVLDKEDCLPDIGLLDYRDEELGLDLKDKTLREVYKAVFQRIGLGGDRGFLEE